MCERALAARKEAAKEQQIHSLDFLKRQSIPTVSRAFRAALNHRYAV